MAEITELSPEEWEYLKSKLTPERPLCWFCVFRPARPEAMDYCEHKPLTRRWREVSRKKHCDAISLDGDRISLRKEKKHEHREQLGLW